MTQREITVLNYINCEDWGNEHWGIHSNPNVQFNSKELFDTRIEDPLPRHLLFVWISDEEANRMQRSLGQQCCEADKVYEMGDEVVLVWDLSK